MNFHLSKLFYTLAIMSEGSLGESIPSSIYFTVECNKLLIKYHTTFSKLCIEFSLLIFVMKVFYTQSSFLIFKNTDWVFLSDSVQDLVDQK